MLPPEDIIRRFGQVLGSLLVCHGLWMLGKCALELFILKTDNQYDLTFQWTTKDDKFGKKFYITWVALISLPILFDNMTSGTVFLVFLLILVSKVPPGHALSPPTDYYTWRNFLNTIIMVSMFALATVSPSLDFSVPKMYRGLIGFMMFLMVVPYTMFYDFLMSDPTFPNRWFPRWCRPLRTLYDIQFEPNELLVLLRMVTAPNMLCRTVQWWGFAIIVNNYVGYCYAIMVTCFCIATAVTKHRNHRLQVRKTHKALIPFVF